MNIAANFSYFLLIVHLRLLRFELRLDKSDMSAHERWLSMANRQFVAQFEHHRPLSSQKIRVVYVSSSGRREEHWNFFFLWFPPIESTFCSVQLDQCHRWSCRLTDVLLLKYNQIFGNLLAHATASVSIAVDVVIIDFSQNDDDRWYVGTHTQFWSVSAWFSFIYY